MANLWGDDPYEWHSEMDTLREAIERRRHQLDVRRRDALRYPTGGEEDEEDGYDEDWDEEKVEDKEKTDPVKSFFEAYDVETIAIGLFKKIVSDILIKKHSDRTEQEKQIIKNIIDYSKKDIPKIHVDRQGEQNDEEAEREENLRQALEQMSGLNRILGVGR